MHVFMHAPLLMRVCFCLLLCAYLQRAARARLAAVPCLYYPRLFSNLVPFNMHSLLCPTSWNVFAATWTPHSATAVCFHCSVPSLCWIEPLPHWNVCHNKSISRRRGNAFERLCVLVRGGLGEHTGMSYAPWWQNGLECQWILPFFASLLYFLPELIHLSQAGYLFVLNEYFTKVVLVIYFWLFFILPSKWSTVMVEGSSLHYSPYSVWWICVSVSEAGPQALASPLLPRCFCACVRASGLCAQALLIVFPL